MSIFLNCMAAYKNTVTIRLSDNQLTALEALAADRTIPAATFIRLLVHDYLVENDEPYRDQFAEEQKQIRAKRPSSE